MRPKPLIPTLIAIIAPLHSRKSILCGRHVFHLHVHSHGGPGSYASLLSRSLSKILANAERSPRLFENPAIAKGNLGARGFSWGSESSGKPREAAPAKLPE